MRHVVLFGAVVVAVVAGFACSSGSGDQPAAEATGEDASTSPPLPPTADTTPEGPAGTGQNTGLPCDVQMVLENRCLACHSGDQAGIPALLTYSNLLAKSNTDPTKSLALVSLERMKSATMPMPPKPAEPADADEIAIFQEWMDKGFAKAAMCTDAPPDGGTSMPPVDGGIDAGGGVVCSSGVLWNMGNEGSELMNPGRECLQCHQVEGGPNFSIAGTVYPTLHEPDLCNGKAGNNQLRVVVTDARNRVVEIPVNAAGNFSIRANLRAPFKAMVTDGVKTRAMQGSVTAGDCNRCHTVNGANGAPGRIMAP